MFEIIDTINRQGNGFENLTGQRFGRLVVEGLSKKIVDRKSYWVCRCDCGNQKLVRSDVLKCGYVRSCGCLKKEQDKLNLDKNGRHYDTQPGHIKRLWRIWEQMRQRCNNSNNSSYERYGGRGIRVCKEWDRYESFRDWALSNGYDDSLSIERKDVNGNYCPKNCMWIPMAEQANNRRSTIWIEWNGEKRNLKQWADFFHLSYSAVSTRYRKGYRPPELFKPSKNNSPPIIIKWNEKEQSLKKWAVDLSIAYTCLYSRYKKGLKPPELFEKPIYSRLKTTPR